MRILVISNLFPPQQLGGYEISCKDTADLLSHANHDVRVLTSNSPQLAALDGPELSGSLYPVDRELVVRSVWEGINENVSYKDVSNFNAHVLAQSFASFKPDVIYVWNLHGLGMGIPKWLFRMAPLRTVFHFMDKSLFAENRGRAGLRRSWAPIPRLASIFCSEWLMDTLGRERGLTNHVIHPPFAAGAAPPPKLDFEISGRVRIAFVGQRAEHKGFPQLVRELELLRNVVSGRFYISLDVFSPNKRQLVDLPQDWIVTHSPRSRDAVLGLLPDFDFGVFPSTWGEPFGMAQVELMAAGLPTLSSLRGGSAEIFDGMNLIPINPDIVGDISSKLRDLIDGQSSRRAALGRRASRVRELLDSESYTASILAVLETVHSDADRDET